jgi:hypothetical protein
VKTFYRVRPRRSYGLKTYRRSFHRVFPGGSGKEMGKANGEGKKIRKVTQVLDDDDAAPRTEKILKKLKLNLRNRIVAHIFATD